MDHLAYKVRSRDNAPTLVQSYGDGDCALIFVHGWGGNSRLWRFQIGKFLEDYRVVTIDLPSRPVDGPVRSDWSIEAYADDLLSVIDSLTSSRFILVGHSMAGRIIARAAALRPEQIIGIIGAEAFWDIEQISDQDAAENFLSAYREDFVQAATGYVDSMFPDKDTNHDLYSLALQGVLDWDSSVAISSLESLLHNNEDQLDWLKNSTCRKALVNSTFWRKTNIPAAKQLNFDCRFISDVSHYLMLEKPLEFNRHLSEIFLNWDENK